MVFTRNDAKDAFRHVMFTVLDFSTEDKMPLALQNEGLDRVTHLISLTDDDLRAIKHVNEKGEREDIPRWQINNVRCFIGYLVHRHKMREPVGEDYLSITKAQLDEYRVSPNFHTFLRIPRPTELSPAKVYDAVAHFRRGTKCDPTLFVTFRDESSFHTW